MKYTVIELNKPDIVKFAKALIDLHKKTSIKTSEKKSR